MDTFPLYFILAGQGNMCGRVRASDVKEKYRAPYPEVQIIWNMDMNIPKYATISEGWQDLQPQPNFFHGRSIGPEIFIGRNLHNWLKQPIYLIKFAMGGTTLDRNWNPDRKGEDKNYYLDFINFCNTWIDDLKSKHPDAKLGGIFWLGGEKEATSEFLASNYEDNLDLFIASLFETFGKCFIDMHHVQIRAKHKDKVNTAIDNIHENSAWVGRCETEGLSIIGKRYDAKHKDPHYDAASLKKIAKSMSDTFCPIYCINRFDKSRKIDLVGLEKIIDAAIPEGKLTFRDLWYGESSNSPKYLTLSFLVRMLPSIDLTKREKIQHLDLASNHLKNKGLPSIVEIVKLLPNLEILDLSFNSFGYYEDKDPIYDNMIEYLIDNYLVVIVGNFIYPPQLFKLNCNWPEHAIFEPEFCIERRNFKGVPAEHVETVRKVHYTYYGI